MFVPPRSSNLVDMDMWVYMSFYGKFVKVLLKSVFLLIPDGIIAQ